jgi:hypothetical protein
MRTARVVSATLRCAFGARRRRATDGTARAQNTSIRTQEFFWIESYWVAASKRTEYFYLLLCDVQFVLSLQLPMRVSDLMPFQLLIMPTADQVEVHVRRA